MTDWLMKSASVMARAIADGDLSSRDLVDAHLDHIATINPTLNAIVQQRAEDALSEADAADAAAARARRAGEPLPTLHGVPFTVKDAIATAGVITTGGIPSRDGLIPRQDATVVKRLQRAGAILLGKTNCPAFCAGAETVNEIYGRTSNPYDPDYSVASSSGGEAAIIAAGGSPFGLGSDTGGSIRFPAHFCGVAGLCPTFGRVPRTGHIPPYFGVPDTSVIGPVARSVADLGLILPILTGGDGIDPKTAPVPVPDPRDVQIADLRIAYHDDNGIFTPAGDVRRVVGDVVATLTDRGADLKETIPPEISEAIEIGQGVSRVSWGHELAADDAYIRRFDVTVADLRGDIDRGVAAARNLKSEDAQLGIEFYFLMWKLDLYRSRMLSWMQDFDALVCPVMGYPAQPHGFSQDEGFSHLGYVGYTHPYSLLGWPSLVVRAGTAENGMPIGIQIIARPWREDVALALGSAVELDLGGWTPPDLSRIST